MECLTDTGKLKGRHELIQTQKNEKKTGGHNKSTVKGSEDSQSCQDNNLITSILCWERSVDEPLRFMPEIKQQWSGG